MFYIKLTITKKQKSNNTRKILRQYFKQQMVVERFLFEKSKLENGVGEEQLLLIIIEGNKI